ncbi:hypothetical protein PINS_up022540 [Pythium insidiosum]|nr:hypothetical protein PINS_up022540 [Pythium insidiosum]
MALFRSGHISRAIALLENARQPANRYLLALCYFRQNHFAEAESALLGPHAVAGGFDQAQVANVPNGAAGLYLLGRICRRANRRQQAVEYFTMALEHDPSLWSAYEELCDLGADIEPQQFFGQDAIFMRHDEPTDTQAQTHFNDETQSPANDERFRTPLVTSGSRLMTPQVGTFRSADSRANPSSSTPQVALFRTPVPSQMTRTPGFGTPEEIVKKPRVSNNDPPPNPRVRKAQRRPLIETDEKQRRNARLSFSSALSDDSPSHDLGKGSGMITPTTRLFQSASVGTSNSPSIDSGGLSTEGEKQLLWLLNSFGQIYLKMSVYRCREALDLLGQLPAEHRASSWALQQVGRAHFELADYNQANDAFQQLFRTEPSRMGGLDVYSTTLWHLKKEVELSYLAQRATTFDKLSPEAWCAAGNCFSLQKEHDTALSFFQRAIQLDPFFTYAYTLSGHEYVANEDFEKAISCYRHAIRIDPRHYNAWYGLGTIYYRQEKFEFAEYHFRRALEINPRSSLLHCFLGMVLHSTQQFDEALDTLAVAGELQPLNPQARFQRANVLITLHRFDEVRCVAPSLMRSLCVTACLHQSHV